MRTSLVAFAELDKAFRATTSSAPVEAESTRLASEVFKILLLLP